jgi:hypothetical protein
MTPDQIADAQHRQDRQLWAAVIMQALDDAAGKIEYYGGNKAAAERHKRLVRRRARDWFINGGRDFKEVCALAGMEPDWVRANALKRIEEADEDGPTKRGRLISYNGERVTFKELSARTGISVSALKDRNKAGKTGAELTAPVAERKPGSITHNGETHTLQEWSKITGIKSNTIVKRIRLGWTIQEALTPGRRMPPAKMTRHQKQALRGFSRRGPGDHSAPRRQTGQLYTHDGKSLTLRQWSDEVGIPLNTLHVRLSRQGWTIEQALTTPLIDPSKRRAGAEARAA